MKFEKYDLIDYEMVYYGMSFCLYKEYQLEKIKEE